MAQFSDKIRAPERGAPIPTCSVWLVRIRDT